MTLETLSFVFGGLLILIGIIGGGFEAKELKIPKVGLSVRIFAILGGLFFIVLGIGIQTSESTPGKLDSSKPSLPVHFIISDYLGRGQVSEQVTVLIDGRNVGTLTVNEDYQASRITVTVPQEGKYSYAVRASAVFDDQGFKREFTGVGQGMIDVKSGKVFTLEGAFSGNTWNVTLIEHSQ